MARRLDRVLVIDVESTCWSGPPPEGQASEIIEIGVCPVDLERLEPLEKRSILVKPVRSEISAFCTELTGLAPEMFAEAVSLRDAVATLRADFAAKERPWASWGDYDRRQFERCCAAEHVRYPFGPTHLNVKTLFATAVGAPREMGLGEAYARLGMQMEGRHHRGHDDAANIARILCRLLRAARADVEA